jgi:hypothetical protein
MLVRAELGQGQIGAQALLVVDVLLPPECSTQRRFVRVGRRNAQIGGVQNERAGSKSRFGR